MVALLFAISTAGDFLPNGGLSPGPRFAAAALPFLVLGLPFALERRRLLTLGLAACSIGLGLFDGLTWSVPNPLEFLTWPKAVWSTLGLSKETGSILLLACGAVAGLLALGPALRVRPVAVLHSSSS